MDFYWSRLVQIGPNIKVKSYTKGSLADMTNFVQKVHHSQKWAKWKKDWRTCKLQNIYQTLCIGTSLWFISSHFLYQRNRYLTYFLINQTKMMILLLLLSRSIQKGAKMSDIYLPKCWVVLRLNSRVIFDFSCFETENFWIKVENNL